jgi:translation initiation factor 6 (eIF-6)
MSLIHPYQNESEAASLDGLEIENRTTHISLYGNIMLTRDKAGLANARQLRDLLNDIVGALEGDGALPEKIASKETVTVKNPFV